MNDTTLADERVFSTKEQPTLHHVCLFVPDIAASVEFYTSGLDLTVREEFDDIIGVRQTGRFPFGVPSVFLEAGAGRYIELHPAGDGEMMPPGFPMNHLALGVHDVDQAYAKALTAGATPFGFELPSEPWDGAPIDVVMSGERPETMRMAFLQGPSGELIELYQAS
ncbi:MAG: VOC family protein [Pseudomonadota bacterium]